MRSKDVVNQIREITGLSQMDFSRLTGLHRTAISQFEIGQRIPRPHQALIYLCVSKKFKLKFKLEDFYRK